MPPDHYILTFTTYGTRLPGPTRGRHEEIKGDLLALPQPGRAPTARQRAALKWPVVALDAGQRRIVAEDIARVADIRGFELLDVAVTGDCVHVLFACPPEADVLRLVQFIKGAPARALSVAAGDAPTRSDSGAPLPHRKWWARQYVLQRLAPGAPLQRAQALFRKRRAAADAG